MLLKLVFISITIVQSTQARKCNRNCFPNALNHTSLKCQHIDDACFALYPPDTCGCFGQIKDIYSAKCERGSDKTSCQYVKRTNNGGRRFKSIFDDKQHNTPEGYESLMCCCHGDNCNHGLGVKEMWTERFCSQCAASEIFDEQTKKFKNITFNHQCSHDKPTKEPRFCYALSIEGNHNEMNCEWKLQDDNGKIKYEDTSKSHCKEMSDNGHKCIDIDLLMKDSTARKYEKRRATLCCCNAVEDGDLCNDKLNANELKHCEDIFYKSKMKHITNLKVSMEQKMMQEPQEFTGFLLIGGGGSRERKTMEVYLPLADEMRRSQLRSMFLNSKAQKVNTKLMKMRNGAISELLPDGRVLTAGGHGGDLGKTTEILDLGTMKQTAGPKMEYNRELPASVAMDGKVFVCGGEGRKGALQTCEVFKNGEWWMHPSMNEKRMEFTLVEVGKSLYAIGGRSKQKTNTVEKYSFKHPKWSNVSPMSKKRSGHGSAVLNGAIYVCAGAGGSKDNSCERYLPNKDKWETIQAMNEGRVNFMMVEYLARIYAVGGGSSYKTEKSVESIDPENDKQWMIEGSLSEDRSESSIVIVPMTEALQLAMGINGTI